MVIIEKIVSPSNRSSKEEYGTIWISDLESGKEVWIQTGADIENPKWKRLGDLYEKSFIESPDLQDSIINSLLQRRN